MVSKDFPAITHDEDKSSSSSMIWDACSLESSQSASKLQIDFSILGRELRERKEIGTVVTPKHALLRSFRNQIHSSFSKRKRKSHENQEKILFDDKTQKCIRRHEKIYFVSLGFLDAHK